MRVAQRAPINRQLKNTMASRLPVREGSALCRSTAIAKFSGCSACAAGCRLRLHDSWMQTLRSAKFDDMVIAG
jgi:hypothetical protein